MLLWRVRPAVARQLGLQRPETRRHAALLSLCQFVYRAPSRALDAGSGVCATQDGPGRAAQKTAVLRPCARLTPLATVCRQRLLERAGHPLSATPTHALGYRGRSTAGETRRHSWLVSRAQQLPHALPLL